MLRFVIALGAVWSFAGCTTSTVRSQEGHACSISSSDDPQLVCTPAQDLVCISTYSIAIQNQQEAMKFDGGIRQVFVCRLACNTSVQCPQPGDICCVGTIFGKTYNKLGACVPPGSCDTMEIQGDGGVTPDTGTVTPKADTGVTDTGAADSGSGTPDVSLVADGGAAG
jgi:hypothetical protein